MRLHITILRLIVGAGDLLCEKGRALDSRAFVRHLLWKQYTRWLAGPDYTI